MHKSAATSGITEVYRQKPNVMLKTDADMC
jgi:hypothetical protein